jgi:phage-related tail protein
VPLYNAIRAMPTVLELYEKLKPKLGEEEARSLLEFIETSVDQRAATKADLQRTESALREELHVTAASLREELHATAASLREEMHKIRAELIKRSFAFWIGNIVVLSGIMFALLHGGR